MLFPMETIVLLPFVLEVVKGILFSLKPKSSRRINLLKAEALDIQERVEYCVNHDLFKLILEMDSLIMQKMLNGDCYYPWVLRRGVGLINEE